MNTRGDAPRVILVVDDEPIITRYLATELESMGFMVHEAIDARDALQVARAHGPLAAAFVDLALSDDNGLDLISKLREQQGGLPIVIASGYGEMALRDVDDRNQAPVVLSKPFDSEMLARCVRSLGLDVRSTAA